MDKSKYLSNVKFLMIPSSWFRLTEPPFNLNHGELILLAKIFELSFNNNGDGACWASNASFAEYMKLSRDTIKRYLKHLDDLNLISRKSVQSDGGTELRLSIINIDLILEYCPFA